MSDFVRRVNLAAAKALEEQRTLAATERSGQNAEGDNALNTSSFDTVDIPVVSIGSFAAADYANPPGVPVERSGYSISLVTPGTSSGVTVDISFTGPQGPWLPLKAGASIKGYFNRFYVRAIGWQDNGYTNAQKLLVQNAKLVIGNNREFDYVEHSNLSNAGFGFKGALGTADNARWYTNAYTVNAYTALYNSAANVPSAVTDGLSLDGVTGVRIFATLAGGSDTIVSGDFRLWCRNGLGLGVWAENQETILMPNAGSGPNLVFNDRVVLMPADRIFVEARAIVTSAGSGAITVYISAWRGKS